MENRRFYWLKLQNDFFSSLRIKNLRKLAGGDTFTIIYLKMQLLSLKTEGVLEYNGLLNTFEEEIALELDEDVANVQITIQYLISCGLIETNDDEYVLPYVQQNTGGETASTIRSRKCRDKQKMLQCNTNATKRNVEKEKDIEIEKEKDIDIEEERDVLAKSKRFLPPTPDEVREYCIERGNNVDAERFCDFYQSKGWMVGKAKMKDWRAAVRNWEKDSKPSGTRNLMEELRNC